MICIHSTEMSRHRTGAGLLLQVHSGKCSDATALGREKAISPLLLGRTVNHSVTEYLTLSSHWIFFFFHILFKPRMGNKVKIKSCH